MDFSWLGDLVPAAVSAVSSWFGDSQASQGLKNANQDSATSAANQQNFQETMSNTAWQRGVADMKLAGINPLYGFSPASSPSGQSVTYQNAAAPWENLGQQAAGAVSAYNASRDTTANVRLTESKKVFQDAVNEKAKKIARVWGTSYGTALAYVNESLSAGKVLGEIAVSGFGAFIGARGGAASSAASLTMEPGYGAGPYKG